MEYNPGIFMSGYWAKSQVLRRCSPPGSVYLRCAPAYLLLYLSGAKLKGFLESICMFDPQLSHYIFFKWKFPDMKMSRDK